jgi:pimeloyl-ACP methyl ester carboxylesterase
MVHMIDRGGDVSLSLASNMTCPLLLILGETDTLNPQEYGQRLVDAAPDATLKMFPCGHGVHQELFEDFQKLVGAFLRGHLKRV